MFHGSTAVPGVDQAFAWGWATTANKSADCVWHWSGGTTWKVTEASQLENPKLWGAVATAKGGGSKLDPCVCGIAGCGCGGRACRAASPRTRVHLSDIQ